MTLPPEVEASYAAIIDNVLAGADLQTISAKRIRKELSTQVGYDIAHQKDEINRLIGERFDKFFQEQQTSAPEIPEPPEPAPNTAVRGATPIPTTERAPATNGISKHKEDSTSVASSPKKRAEPDSSIDRDTNHSEEPPSPPKKKQKRQKPVEEDDAAFAARLQAEENKLSRARSTRGGGAKKKSNVKKDKSAKKKAKSAKKVHSDDDSDLDSANGEKKEVNRTGGFHKPMGLSPPLSELLGETQLSRPQCVKKIWEYIKARDLQDPSDKRQIRCDDRLRTVFKTDKVHMFTMNKILNQNLYALDE